ncbi:LysM peptidoglycan-binding domain-containing protein [Rhodanobacter thiooxydans]|uniref:LysM peptidoglycan-binding domain-containing protein n=1 Tax=Rhodanobacter thiooxydans TaxID=416169 RepID=UPI000D3ACCFE|nr:LysM peptidoglycan-binding domain-containing protein [Rhodanobacter thiooxydans]
MPGCDADPAVLAWARRYTRHPQQFESQLQAVLPRLVYVQQVADRYDVAGEFVLLPWVESHFQPVPARKRRPAGMWQIMPVTAGAMGLRVDGHYDGRLDVPAAANAVMKLLEQYHEQFHDWRVADYAYNAGEFTIRKMIRTHGMPAQQPAIPPWPVRKVTREHLTKLLGMACVVREPGRFNVSLPTLPDEQHLVQTGISHSMPIARAADRAGMSVAALKHLNPAFRNDMIDAGTAPYLILPARHARQFSDALLEQASSAGGDLLADLDARTTTVPTPDANTTRKTHTVKRGDNLWQIARDYSVNIGQLQRWNHLSDHTLKPGQKLTVSAPN